MKRLTHKETRRYKAALRADVSETVKVRSAQGPLGLLQLASEVQRRLRSSGGRPTMAEWELKRPVPFSRKSWRRLGEIGQDIGLSPAQFAALIVEKALATFTAAMVDEARQLLEQEPTDFPNGPRRRRAASDRAAA